MTTRDTNLRSLALNTLSTIHEEKKRYDQTWNEMLKLPIGEPIW